MECAVQSLTFQVGLFPMLGPLRGLGGVAAARAVMFLFHYIRERAKTCFCYRTTHACVFITSGKKTNVFITSAKEREPSVVCLKEREPSVRERVRAICVRDLIPYPAYYEIWSPEYVVLVKPTR